MQRYLVVSEWMFVWAIALFLLNIMICISPACSRKKNYATLLAIYCHQFSSCFTILKCRIIPYNSFLDFFISMLKQRNLPW
jgi:hypothetical protein